MTALLNSRWFSLLLYSLVVGIFAACVLAFRNDLAKMPLDALPAATGALLLTALLSLLNYLLRAWRWQRLFKRIGHTLPLGYAILTYVAGFAFTLSPGKVGELVRAAYYRRRGIPLAPVTAVFFAERLSDLAVMITLASLFLAAGAGSYAPLLWGAGLCVPLAIVLLAAIRREHIERIDAWCQTRHGLVARAAHLALHALSSAKVLVAPGTMLMALVLGFVAWGAEGVGLHLLGALAPHLALDINTAIGIYAIAIVVGALSFLPGGLGTAEAVMVALLVHHGFALPDALLMTLACRILTLWFAIGLGWLAVVVLRLQGEGDTESTTR